MRIEKLLKVQKSIKFSAGKGYQIFTRCLIAIFISKSTQFYDRNDEDDESDDEVWKDDVRAGCGWGELSEIVGEWQGVWKVHPLKSCKKEQSEESDKLEIDFFMNGQFVELIDKENSPPDRGFLFAFISIKLAQNFVLLPVN